MSETLILHIETATDICSVALSEGTINNLPWWKAARNAHMLDFEFLYSEGPDEAG